jgi:hypothetical protein
MSTPAYVGVLQNNPEEEIAPVKYVYVNNDGYVSDLGKTLLLNYTTPESVEALIALGDMSVVGDTLEACEAYHRDLGEDWSDNSPNFSSLLDYQCKGYVHAIYLFMDGKWVYTRPHRGRWCDLADARGED